MFDSNLSYSTLLKNPAPFPEIHKYNLPQIIKRGDERREKIYKTINRKRKNFTSTAQKKCTLLVCFLKNILKLYFIALAESTKPFSY